MTKDELEEEAGKYADKHAFRVPYDGSNKFYDDVDFKASKEGYLVGAEPREKRIAELEKSIKLRKQQLTKAKEIIRALLKHTYGQNLNTQNDFDLYLGRIKEADQFLRENK